MRTLAIAFAAVLAMEAFAQSAARPRPAGTRPLEEPPPPPPVTQPDTALEPQVSIRINEAGDTVQEYRVNGRLFMQRVTPRGGGRQYVLMDHKGDGSFTRLDNTIDGRLQVPQWVLLEF